MGYAGGTGTAPTYEDLDGHSETIQIDYDPALISYRDLLDVFWDSQNPLIPSYSSQYKSIIFYHNEEQRLLAIESKRQESSRLQSEVFTEIVPFTDFYLAEGYHQKYYLRHEPEILDELTTIYPIAEDFIASTASARLNGLAGGYGNVADLEARLDDFGLSETANKEILKIAGRGIRSGCPL